MMSCGLPRLGRRQGVLDVQKVRVHKLYVAKLLRYPPQVAVHENVPDYDVTVLDPLVQAGWEIQTASLDPRLFGWPLSRPRKYRILLNTSMRCWVYKEGPERGWGPEGRGGGHQS
jgi:hypothetical protein